MEDLIELLEPERADMKYMMITIKKDGRSRDKYKQRISDKDPISRYIWPHLRNIVMIVLKVDGVKRKVNLSETDMLLPRFEKSLKMTIHLEGTMIAEEKKNNYNIKWGYEFKDDELSFLPPLNKDTSRNWLIVNTKEVFKKMATVTNDYEKGTNDEKMAFKLDQYRYLLWTTSVGPETQNLQNINNELWLLEDIICKYPFIEKLNSMYETWLMSR